MKNIFIFFALLFCYKISAAISATNVVGLEIETNGWILRATMGGNNTESFGTNGNFFNGLGTNNSLSSTTALIITLTSMGYDDTGAGKQVQRTVYGTKIIRRPYPMQNTNDITAIDSIGTNVVFRIALSDFIYSTDSNITATAVAGWLVGNTNTAASTNASGMTAQTVTNSSTLEHPKVVGTWSLPGWNHETNMTVVLRGVFFHRSAQEGRPVRVVRYTISDETGHSVSTNVTRPEIDWAFGDAVPVVEYIGRLDCGSLSNGAAIRCDFVVWPWVGNTNSVVDTIDNVNPATFPYYGAITNVFDTNFAQKITFAVVDATSGNDTNGRATNDTGSVVGSAPEANPCLTIGRAITLITTTNNSVYGRNNYGRGVIYLRTGLHSWCGATASPGGPSHAWLTVTRHPSDAKDGVSIQRLLTGTQSGGTRVKLYDIALYATNGWCDTIANTNAAYWIDRCIVAETNAQAAAAVLIQASGSGSTAVAYITRSYVSNVVNSLKPFGTQKVGYGLIRGNDFSLYTNQISPHMVIGNYRAGTNTYNIANFITTAPNSGNDFLKTNWVIAFNRFYGWMSANAVNPIMMSLNQGTETNLWGGALVQNVMETWNGTNGNATVACASDSATGPGINNIIHWNNTLVGARMNACYNDTGTTSYDRANWSDLANLYDDDNIKTDTFGTPSGARIGNWSGMWGVGRSGNLKGELAGGGGNVGINGFTPEFSGMNGKWLISLTNTLYKFTANGAWNGTAGGFGTNAGNYRLLSDSPVWLQPTPWVLPYDIEGAPRGAIDPAGAYSSGQPRKTTLF